MNNIQLKILEIFKEVKKICEKNNLAYYAIGGTCIGAVRHKGFIPWDDDLDIAVPIEEWDRFWECMERELPSKYQIYRSNKIKHYRYVFNKIHDSTTTFIEEAEKNYPDAYKGIFVDVMPIAGIPEDQHSRERFYKSLKRLYKLNFIRRYPIKEMENNKRKLLWLALRIVSPFISFHYYSDKWIETIKKIPLKDCQYTGYTWWEGISDRLCFPIQYFEKTTMLPFEDTEISCPVDWNGYLSQQFGEYMIVPPEEERLDHHQEYVSTTKPYKEYKGATK